MDKCKYFLKYNGATLMFTSDAELTQFIKLSQSSNMQIAEAVPALFESNPKFSETIYSNLIQNYKSNDESFNEQKENIKQSFISYLQSKGITFIAFHHSNTDIKEFKTFPEGYYPTELKKNGKYYPESENAVFFVKKPLTEEFMSKRPYLGIFGLTINSVLSYPADKKIGEGIHQSIDAGIREAFEEGFDAVDFGLVRDNKTWSEVIVITNPSNALSLNSDATLNDFKQYFSNKKTALNFFKFSKDGDGINTAQDQVIDSIIKNNPGMSDDFIKGDNFLKEKYSIDGKSPELLVPTFGEEYIKAMVPELLATKYKELAETDKAKAIKVATEEIENELKFDNALLADDVKLPALINSFMKGVVTGTLIVSRGTIKPIIDAVIAYNKRVDPDFAYTEEDRDLIEKHLISEFNNWASTYIVNKPEKFLTKPSWLNKQQSINNNSGISSPVSFLSVDNDGTVDIYDVRVSRKAFSEWDSAKKRRIDYHLGLNRHLIEDILPPTYNTRLSSLYVVPIIFPTDVNGQLDLKNFYIDKLVERSKTKEGDLGHSELAEDGRITQNLRKILPNKIKEDPIGEQRITELNDKVLGIIFPKYNFRTKYVQKDAEKFAKHVIDNHVGMATIQYRNKLTDNLIEEPNTTEGKEKFIERMKEYFLEYEKNRDSQMLNLIKILKESKKNGVITYKYASEGFINTFSKYLDENWELVTNKPSLTAAGILLFKNNKNLEFETVSVTINDLHQINNLGLGDTILGKFYKNTEFQDKDRIWKASTTNIEIIKTLAALNNDPDIVRGYTYKNAKVYNNLNGTFNWINDFKGAFYNFDLLLREAKKDLELPNHFKNDIKVGNTFEMIYSSILEAMESLDDKRMLSEFAKANPDTLQDNKSRLTYLLEIRSQLQKAYPSLEKLDIKSHPNYGDPKVYLYSMLNVSIQQLLIANSEYDFDAPDYGIGIGDFAFIFKHMFYGDQGNYDSKGNKIVGMFQGNKFSTLDALPSKMLTKINDIITLAQNKMVSAYNPYKNKVVNITRSMYKDLGRSDIEQTLIGDADKYHEVFFEKNGGKISNDFMLKNPYDLNANLNTLQRNYLKKYIHVLYLARSEANKDLDTLEKFEKSPEFAQLMESELMLIRRVPLIHKQSNSVAKVLTTDNFHRAVGNFKDTVLSALDYEGKSRTESDYEQKIGIQNTVNGMGKIHNRFAIQKDDDFRQHLIEKHGTTYWEVNLDTIALKLGFENLREQYFNKVLPMVDASVQAIKFYGYSTGNSEEVDKVLDTLDEQLKVAVFNTSPIKGKEYEDALNLVRTFQKVTSIMVLALRPVSLIKELVVGTIKNTSYAWSKVYGKDNFSGEDLTTAYKWLFEQKHYSLINELNNNYRIANRDLNQLVDKTKVDRRGLNFFSNFMYWSNTAPDYINRLALVLAKMHKDGSFEAHSLDAEGNLKYDPRKDKRFSYYFEKREQYNYQAHHTDEKYNDQRSLYLTHIEEFNGNNLLSTDKLLTEKDLIPEAYTNKERESMKTFTELAYGYYDHERSPIIKHLPLGIMFGQFMTFWPAKVKYYFAPQDTTTKRGHFEQKYEIVEGKKIPVYAFYDNDENGAPVRREVLETDLKPGQDAMKATYWVGDPFEGLMYSLGMTARALFKGEIDETPEYRINNAKLMLHDLIVAMISIFLGLALFSKDEDVEGSKTAWDEMGQYQRVMTRILMRSSTEFDPFQLIGSVQTTPAFITKMAQTKKDLTNVFSGNSSMEKFFTKNFNFLELAPLSTLNPFTRN